MDERIKIDPEDKPLLDRYRWYVRKTHGSNNLQYAYGLVDGKFMPMHRLIMNPSPSQDVDHINGNGLDNRKSNLRCCSRSQNMANSGIRSHNTSGYKGVSWDKFRNKWKASMTYNGKTLFLARTDDPIEAAKIYDRKALELHGEFARVNFPSE